MYEITYYYLRTETGLPSFKSAYVCANTSDQAISILKNQYLVDAIRIVGIHQLSIGTVAFTNGRF